MKHRIFIAINLPEEIKNELMKYQEKWPDLPAKWTKKENMHITLNFLGNISEERLADIVEKVKEVAIRHSCFDVNFDKISYAPKDKIPPRMIWAQSTEKNLPLIKLKKDLDEKLNNFENKDFSCHITLARIRNFDWQKSDLEEIPNIEQDINLSFKINSIKIIESRLKRSGPEYSVIQSYNLI